MKKALVLVAGLFLASGTIFAEGKIDFSGTSVRYQQLISNSEYHNQRQNDSNWGTDAVLNLNYKIDDKNFLNLKYSTDDDDEFDEAGGDSVGSLILKRVDGQIEAQFETEISISGEEKDIQEKYNSINTYVKYNVKNDLFLTAYPYNMGTTVGSWFGDSDNASEIGGIVVTKGKLNVGLGFDQTNGFSGKEIVTALKADYSFNLGGIYLKTQYSGVFFDENNLSPFYTWEDKDYPNNEMLVKEKNRLGVITQQADIYAYKKVGDKLALMGELAYNKLVENSLKLGDEFIDSGAAAMFRAEYNATEKLKPYVQVKYITDGFLNYWRQKEYNVEGKTSGKDKYLVEKTTINGKDIYSLKGVKTGGTTEYILGAEYKLRNDLVATLEGQIVQAGEKIFYTWATDTKHAEKNYYELTTGLTYYF